MSPVLIRSATLVDAKSSLQYYDMGSHTRPDTTQDERETTRWREEKERERERERERKERQEGEGEGEGETLRRWQPARQTAAATALLGSIFAPSPPQPAPAHTRQRASNLNLLPRPAQWRSQGVSGGCRVTEVESFISKRTG
eukprot:3518200-Rhodomonas_salina.1